MKLILPLLLLPFLVPACSGGADPVPTATATVVLEDTPTPNVDREVARGKRLADQNACVGCHTIDGRDQVGPTWKGLYGKIEELENGDIMTVDETYLRESIESPNTKLVKGYLPDIMPEFDLTDDEINALVIYIKSLQ